MKNLEVVKGYSMEELKAIYDEAVKDTKERWYGPNGDGISRYDQSEKFGGLISMICVNEDDEIFHYYDLPWSFLFISFFYFFFSLSIFIFQKT